MLAHVRQRTHPWQPLTCAHPSEKEQPGDHAEVTQWATTAPFWKGSGGAHTEPKGQHMPAALLWSKEDRWLV